ncbi:hypothetical protein AB0F42_19285 [Streptomyces buecherae]|uniref:hypothetical protein n=1 Tax=Streptomyces buecherae TaxID=2763006 RepID=UPI0033D9FB63
MTPAQAKRLAADPDVADVQQSLMVYATEGGSQLDPPSWGLDAVDGKQDKAYNYPGTGAGVTAYVIDSGARFSRQTFEGRASSGYDFLDNDTDAADCFGHGTHVAGAIAGKEYGVIAQERGGRLCLATEEERGFQGGGVRNRFSARATTCDHVSSALQTSTTAASRPTAASSARAVARLVSRTTCVA